MFDLRLQPMLEITTKKPAMQRMRVEPVCGSKTLGTRI
jgi:hypothetical protein